MAKKKRGRKNWDRRKSRESGPRWRAILPRKKREKKQRKRSRGGF